MCWRGEGGAGCGFGGSGGGRNRLCGGGEDFNGASSGEKTSNLCKFRFVIFRIILVS